MRAHVRASRALLLLAGTLFFLWAGDAPAQRTTAGAGYRVIVHSSNPVGSLSKQEIAAIFMKRTTTWAGGQPMQPVDLPLEAAVRDRFSRDIIGKAAHAVKAYWNQMIFTARKVPPPERASDTDVIEFVRANPSAIGYVSESARLEGVKVVRIGL
ncbi:MAG TPA: hypothetical protein VHM67_02630 [Gemmatimonadaceae bacterium]|nr:hypothetical protein [Gemmatimonadaceae bacterium]